MVRRRASVGALLVAALACGMIPAPAGAWMPNTHRRVASDALELLPAKMREALRPRLREIERGSIYPDVGLMDFEHHAYCLEISCGDAPDYIAAEFTRFLNDLTTPRWARALSALALVFPAGCSSRTGPDEETTPAFKLGEISHYLADVNSPYHSVPYVEPVQTRHLNFEREIEANLAHLRATYDGRADDISADLRSFAIGQVRAARDDLAIVDDPTVAHASAPYHAAVDRSYSRAVNAVADYWYSVLLRVPLD